MIEHITRITCDHCGKQIEVSRNIVLLLLHMYVKHGWTFYNKSWFCDECRPTEIEIDVMSHPHYSDFRDCWDNRPQEKCKSHYFENEPYDHYADQLQHDLCEICDYATRGYEDDGSSWLMCCVDSPCGSYGHNLYSGHFYGSAIRGRICPYFKYGEWEGRDPKKDKENGCFHVPYDECYDGD